MESITFKCLNQSTWPDLELLFGEMCACGGCWCMYWRLTNKEYTRSQGAGIVEACPTVPKKDKMPDVFAWVGFINSFTNAGLLAELNPSEPRAIMRFYCK